MPVYVYRCSNCGFEFDQQQSFSEDSLTKCPECGKKTLKKVYQPVGIVFKGSGFYATDHHSPSGQLPKKDDNGNKDGGEKKDGEAKVENSTEKKEPVKPKEPATKPADSAKSKE